MALSTLCKFSAIASSQVSSRKFFDGTGMSTTRYVSGNQNAPPPPSENAVAQLLKKIMDTIRSNDVVKDIQQKIGIPPSNPPPKEASQINDMKQKLKEFGHQDLADELSKGSKGKGRK